MDRSDEAREAIDLWLQVGAVWPRVTQHPEIARRMPHAAARAALDARLLEKNAFDEDFWNEFSHSDPSPSQEEKHQAALKAFDETERKCEREAFCAERDLLDADIMGVAIHLLEGGGQVKHSLQGLAGRIAGFDEERRPRTESEETEIKRVRTSLLPRLERVAKTFDLFEIRKIERADGSVERYEISASELLIRVFYETFLPALREVREGIANEALKKGKSGVTS